MAEKKRKKTAKSKGITIKEINVMDGLDMPFEEVKKFLAKSKDKADGDVRV
jgi:hypothetical protein